MKIFAFIISACISVGLILILNTKYVLPAPLGKLLSPQHGIWQNAEPADEDFSASLHFPNLEGASSVYFDERLVPHVFAEKENDAYFIQGYLHAKFRLWQMELQVLAADGRISEVIGKKGLEHDREFRRLGMRFAAERSLEAMENNPSIKPICDAYTAGVNAYIQSLTVSQLPIEYKLIGYKPELWSNLKTALFLKYMSYDLAAGENDFEMTNAQRFFSPSDYTLLFPASQDSADPIIPKDTKFLPPSILVKAPENVDSVYMKGTYATVDHISPDRNNGSNNWAVSGTKTATGAPILCNDPHLGLNLPSLWYEMQLSTPSFNAYGATFPGAPSVIIGFNDSCAFGFTNGGRDVRDYYEIKFKDDSRKEYWFNNEWKETSFRYEQIKIAGEATMIDTVAYTIFGPVMYDKSYAGKRSDNVHNYAVRWKAHDSSNELEIFTKLNKAKNYQDYVDAPVHFQTPGQNIVFADKAGEIALRTQGDFPAKWNHQGDFIMPGTDSSYMWQGMIPQSEVPYQYNPERGFVSSANQRPVDKDYPYYLGNIYPSSRGKIINRRLAEMTQITVDDMKKLQTDNYNIFAEMARPIFLKYTPAEKLNADEKKYYDLLAQWDLRNENDSKGATTFVVLFDQFRSSVFNDEYANAPSPILKPYESTLLEAVLRDSAYKFIDNISTAQVETIHDICLEAFQKASKILKSSEAEGKLAWGKFKDTRVDHLGKIPAFSRLHLPIGGGTNIINATKENHGPSWRMVVSLTEKTEAYGIYPGGQSGNPGSKYYDEYIDKWVKGEYYPLWMMTKEEAKDSKVKWVMTFKKS